MSPTVSSKENNYKKCHVHKEEARVKIFSKNKILRPNLVKTRKKKGVVPYERE